MKSVKMPVKNKKKKSYKKRVYLTKLAVFANMFFTTNRSIHRIITSCLHFSTTLPPRADVPILRLALIKN